MKEVCIGLVGGGYAADLHCNGYRNVHGVSVRLKSVADIDEEKARITADTYGFQRATDSFEELLADSEIEVIDICTPPHLHLVMAERALGAGKHVICEKPLTGYFGEAADAEPVGNSVSKAKMLEKSIQATERLRKVIQNSSRRFMYAENYVYSPGLQKAAEIIRNRKSKILFAKGEESLKGSSSPLASEWKYTGGGVLIRAGIHPLTGILWLKHMEANARGERIRVESVSAETGRTSAGLSAYEHRHIAARPHDVEDFAAVSLSFSDGTRALVIACDTALGGTRNYVELFCNDAALNCVLTPTNLLDTYFLDENGMDNVYISEMLPAKVGWNKAFVSDEIIRGYAGELQNFMDVVAHDAPLHSGFDLAALTVKVIYASYQSAEEGRRIAFPEEEQP